MSIRLSWLSNSVTTATGYGNQSALFVPRLNALGYPTSVVAFWGCQGSMMNVDGLQVYPAFIDSYGNDIVGAHAQHWRADCILSLIDAWVMKPEMWNGLPWVALAPIDSDYVTTPAGTIERWGKVIESLRKADVAIAYSKFGHDAMKQAGIDALYVPHGTDTKAYAPMPMAEARAQLGWPQDAYLVGMVAANKGYPARKAWAEQISAFATFKAKVPGARLYVHTNIGPEYGGLMIQSLCEQYGLKAGVDVGWCDQYQNILGFPTDHMRAIYCALDVFMNVSCGEGFGIPNLEAAACGTPIITGDWTACSELCWAGWKVPKSRAHPEWTPLEALQWRPHPDGIVEQLHAAYASRGDQALRARAREGAMEYDADYVTERYWKPVLEEVEHRLGRPRLVAGPIAEAAA